MANVSDEELAATIAALKLLQMRIEGWRAAGKLEAERAETTGAPAQRFTRIK
jgi:hypothetical protein